MPPLIPDDEEPTTGINVTLPESMWRTLQEIADAETAARKERGAKGQVSRNKVVRYFLEWAIADYRKEKGLQAGRERDETGQKRK